MLKNKILKNKRAGSAGDTMSLVVTFAILLLIFVFALIWTKGVTTEKIISFQNPFSNKDYSIFIPSPVILSKSFIAQQISQKLNIGVLENEK